MRKLILPIFVFAVLFIASNSYSQNVYDVEGYYSVGKTGCTITWDTVDRVFKVYWDNGISYTQVYYVEQLPNGNYVYDEYESNGSTYTGTFTFKSSHNSGVYNRKDGKQFKVNR